MKKKEIQQQYNVSERLFFRLIEEQKILRISYRDYEIDKVFFKDFSTEKFWQEYKNRDDVKTKRLIANKKRSESMIKYCADASVRKAMSDRATLASKNPETKKKKSNATKENWKKESYRQKQKIAMDKRWSNQENRDAQSKRLTKYFSIKENRIKHSIIMQNYVNAHYDNMQSKQYNTKKANKSFNGSKIEKQCYLDIKNVYEDSISHYRCDRYPFNCDIYVPSIDTFIELHFGWTHLPWVGAFDNTNQCHLKVLEELKEKAKTSMYYCNAIKTWTDLDIRKRQCAKDNKLNWLCFYYVKDFYKWLETQ